MALPNEYAIRAYLARREVIEPYLREYQNLTKFSQFMGETNDNIIMVKRVKTGNTVVIPVNQVFYDMNIKHGSNEVLVGTEQELTYDYMQFNVNRQRWAMKITDEQFNKLVYGHDFPADIKRNLLEQAENNLNRRMIQSFPGALTYQSNSPLANNDLSLVNRVWDWATLKAKVLACGIDANGVNGDNVSSQRIMFGLDNNWANGAAVSNTVSAALQAVNFGTTPANFAANQFNISHIRKCIKLAKAGNRPTDSVYVENPIKPYRIEAGRKGYADSVFLMLISPSAYEFAVSTADWQAQVTRGVIERQEQPSILWGSDYKGTIEGAMIVTVPEFDQLLFPCRGVTNATSALATYSVFLGRGAIAYGISGTPEVRYDERDYQIVRGVSHNEICGLRPIKFSSKNNGAMKGNQLNPIQVDVGMLHSFASISNT